MRLTKKAEYGLRTLINLGIARELKREPVTLSELALAENLPLKFLEQILIQLRTEGYVTTIRGKSGGYSLARDPNALKLGEIVRLLDGPLAPIACASRYSYERCSCPDENHCGLRMVMIDVRNAIANILDRYSIANVVEVTLRKIRRDGAEHYFFRKSTSTAADTEAPENPADPSEGFLAELLGDSR